MGVSSDTGTEIRSRADLSHAVALDLVEALSKVDRLEPADIALCTGALLDKIKAPSIRDTIFVDKDTGVLYLDGKPQDEETQERFITQARDAKANRSANMARELIMLKVEYATGLLARNASTQYDLVFAKAAMWALQQIDLVYAQLLGMARPGHSEPEESE